MNEARVLPSEVLLGQHVPGDRRVSGGGDLRRSRIADLALHCPKITQAGIMAYVVVSQGSKSWDQEKERKVQRWSRKVSLAGDTSLQGLPHPHYTSGTKETEALC